MRNVTIGLVQLESRVGDKDYNLKESERLVREAAARGAQIVCLPELFVTGYNLAAFGEGLYDLAEGLSGPAITAMRALAKELGVYLIAPIALQAYTTRPLNNAAVVIDDQGEVQGTYSKNHLFGGECGYFTRTGEYPVFDTKYGRIGIMICADNNYPEPARILALKGAEIIFMPAAWRVQESDIWPLLIRCHALENNVYVAAANQYADMGDLFLFGHSMIAGPRGQVIEELTQEGGGLIVRTVDLDEIYACRANMPSLKDRHPEDYGVLCAPVSQ